MSEDTVRGRISVNPRGFGFLSVDAPEGEITAFITPPDLNPFLDGDVVSATLKAAGLGQSTAVSIGGDAIIGQTYAELMPLFEADEETQAIVIYTEPGGRMEKQLADWVTEHDSRLPIVAFMAGRFMDEMPGMSFGHAGTIVEGKEDTATEKIARLAEAGIVVAERIEDIPDLVKERI